MANFCFFTDTKTDIPNGQIVGDTFGFAIRNPKAKHGMLNLHTGESPLSIFVIIQGEILMQEMLIDPSLVRKVLKSNVQHNFNYLNRNRVHVDIRNEYSYNYFTK